MRRKKAYITMRMGNARIIKIKIKRQHTPCYNGGISLIVAEV